MVPSYPCIGPFLLSTYREEFIATPNIITFPPNPLANEKVPCLSNPIPYPEYLHLSKSAYFTNSTAPNKEFSSTG